MCTSVCCNACMSLETATRSRMSMESTMLSQHQQVWERFLSRFCTAPWGLLVDKTARELSWAHLAQGPAVKCGRGWFHSKLLGCLDVVLAAVRGWMAVLCPLQRNLRSWNKLLQKERGDGQNSDCQPTSTSGISPLMGICMTAKSILEALLTCLMKPLKSDTKNQSDCKKGKVLMYKKLRKETKMSSWWWCNILPFFLQLRSLNLRGQSIDPPTQIKQRGNQRGVKQR